MGPSLSDLLRCPSCASPFRETGPSILECGCLACPVLSGIPVLLDEPFARRALAALRKGGEAEALAVALAHYVPIPGLAARIARKAGWLPLGRARGLVADADLSFRDAAAALGRAREADYFVDRSSQDPFRAGKALLDAAPPGPALDVGCGAGHLAAACRGRLVVGLDRNFPLLYLARRFVHPSGLFVCVDACRALPYAEGAFAAALSMDVFQYLPDRERVAAEMDRVTRRDGRVILSHLRNRRPESPFESPSLPPEAYARMFPSRPARFWPEEAWTRGAPPSSDTPPSAINAGRPYVLVAGPRPSP